MRIRFAIYLLSVLSVSCFEVLASNASVLTLLIENNRIGIEESDFQNKKTFLVFTGAPTEKIFESPTVKFTHELGISTGIVEAVNPEEMQKQVLFEFRPESQNFSCDHEKRTNQDGSYGALIDLGEVYGVVVLNGQNWLTNVNNRDLENCVTTAFLSFYGIEYEMNTERDSFYARKLLSIFSKCASYREKIDPIACSLANFR